MATITKDKVKLLRKLYVVDKHSTQEVANVLGVGLGAVIYAMRKYDIKLRNKSEANAVTFEKKTPSFTLRTYRTTKDKALDIVGAMLYWAEGHKTSSACGIDFANSDTDMIRVFMNFMRSRYVLDEGKFRVYLYTHNKDGVIDDIKYWSKVTGIPAKQFTKPQIVESKNRRHFRVMEHGMVNVRYHDKKMLKDILNLIHYYKSRFGQ